MGSPSCPPETYRLIRLHCDAATLGRHALRGVPEPAELFLLVSQLSRASSFVASR